LGRSRVDPAKGNMKRVTRIIAAALAIYGKKIEPLS
jgi:hypothetical protein